MTWKNKFVSCIRVHDDGNWRGGGNISFLKQPKMLQLDRSRQAAGLNRKHKQPGRMLKTMQWRKGCKKRHG